MTACETCRQALLDHRFGLLDAAEAAALDGHLAGCPDCQAAAAEADRVHRLIAAAARADFPVPPIRTLVKAPARRPAAPLDPTRTVRAALTQWMIAASLLLATCGLLVPTLRDAAGHWRHAPVVRSEAAAAAEAAAAVRRRGQDILAARDAAADRTKAVQADHDKLVGEWVAAEAEAVKVAAARPFAVTVRGPAAAVAGAPNEYEVLATTATGRPFPARVAAEVTDAAGAKLFAQTLPDTSKPVRLPASLWAKAAAGSPLTLTITATDPKTGAASRVTETVKLRDPVYTTFLSTDKPLYRPGEAVYYRSVTLDRAGFRPPATDYPVRFEIESPAGQVVAGSESVGTTVPADPKGTPVTGPDGKPVRGVGTGAFVLPAGLAGGEYKLKAFALPPTATAAPAGSVPAATQKFTVFQYTPDRLDKTLEFDAKTYGPGDTVQAKVTVRDQAKAAAGAKLDIGLTVTVAGQRRALNPDVAPAATDVAGAAAVKFTLPAGDLTDAGLTVTVRTPAAVETLVRRVPLASRKLAVEFFPEGGDLLAGVPGRVYLRATTAAGKPADIRGVLTDGTRDISPVSTLTDADQPGVNQGHGVVAFIPEAGRRYFVKLSAPAGTDAPVVAPTVRLFGTTVRPAVTGYALPAVQKSGVGLTVEPGVVKPGESLRVKLQSAGAKRAVVVGVYLRGLPLAHRRANLEPVTPTDLAIDLGPAGAGGVMRVTVFEEPAGEDADLKPVAERLVFRAPAEALKLAYTAGRPGDANPGGAFVPGERVELTVTSTDEAGRPKPAVLMAAVVSQSVITMADDKTARRLPTHFLLTNELQNPADLEYADFLLTDHPKAGVALDLLLGTQGWRRFAEQAPDLFRRRGDPAEADRLMAAVGARGPVPASWGGAAHKVFDTFWPRYQEAVAALDRAAVDDLTGAAVRPLIDDYRAAQRDQLSHGGRAERAAGDLIDYEVSLARRADLWPVTITLAFAAGFAFVGVRRLSRSVPERRWLLRGGVGFVVLGAALLAVAVMSAPDRTLAAKLGSDRRNHRYSYSGPADYQRAAAAVANPQVEAAVAAVEQGQQRGGAALLGFNKLEGEFRGDQQPNGFAEVALPMARAAADPAPAKPAARPQPRPGARVMGSSPAPVPAAAGAAGTGAGESGKNIKRLSETPSDGTGLIPGERFLRKVPGAKDGYFLEMRDGESELFVGRDLKRRGRFGFRSTPAGPERRLTADALGRSTLPAFLTVLSPDKLQTLERIRQQMSRLPARVVREYAHARPDDAAPGQPRADFAETLLWKPVVVTDAAGKVTLPFDLSDAVTGYQVLVAGHTTDGRIGAAAGTIEVRKPFALDFKLPPEIGSSDRVEMPVLLTNATQAKQMAAGKVTFAGADGPAEFDLPELAPGGARRFVRLTPKVADGPITVTGEATMTAADGGVKRDAVTRTVAVVPDGFPVAGAASELVDGKAVAKLTLPPEWVQGSLTANVTFYPNPMTEMQAGLEGLLREPHGCFEQTSTTNYPNVLVLDYLRETNQARPDVAKRARDYLETGYARLVGFECPVSGTDKKLGFEWFGAADRPHEALTAYGLVQFTDMARVYPVDAALLARTKQFLLNRRDGKGGFQRIQDGHGFGRVSEPVYAAYICWAISEAEKETFARSDLGREVEALKDIAGTPGHPAAADPYFLALAAGTCLNRGDGPAAVPMLRLLARRQAEDGGVAGAATSITQSGGRDLLVESTGLAVLAWVAAADPEFTLPVQNAVKFLTGQRANGGTFGSTQATILALKALTAHARANKKPAEAGELRVLVGGKEVGKAMFTTADAAPVVVPLPAGALKPGACEVTVESSAKTAYPATVEWTARSRKPADGAECAVGLRTTLDRPTAAEGESVRLAVELDNRTDRGHGMTVAVVGLPAGLQLPADMKQLKKLLERPAGGEPVVSYYETRGRELILYWRSLAPKQAVRLDIDLVADIPGTFTGPASRAYLYYAADVKAWVAPLAVTVAAKKE